MSQVNVDIDYLYDIYVDEYEDELNENLLSKEEFADEIMSVIEDKIREKEF